MRRTAIPRSGILIACSLLLALTLSAMPAAAERFHVQSTGTRVSGASTPDDWAPENCYATLADAVANATAADSLLMFKESHQISAELEIGILLANQDLDADQAQCLLIFSSGAGLTMTSFVGEVILRGLIFKGSEDQRVLPALSLNNGTLDPQIVRIQDCTFTSIDVANTFGSEGGCIEAVSNASGLDLFLTRCVFTDNRSVRRGGAVFIGDGCTVDFTDCQFLRNLSQDRGGALGVSSPALPSFLSLTDCEFADNSAWGPGGALAVEDASLIMVRCEVRDSRSALEGRSTWSAGAGLFMRRNLTHTEYLGLSISWCTFVGNHGNLSGGASASDGGGVQVRGETDRYVDVTVTDTYFENNYNAQGGGLYIGRYAIGTVDRCYFIENTAFWNGGASYKGGALSANLGETATYNYCIFIGNRAGYDLNSQSSNQQGRGGAVTVRLYPRAEFYNCSFSENEVGGSWQQGDGIAHSSEGRTFSSDMQRCKLFNCVFYGTSGNDFQAWTDSTGFSEVANCAYELDQLEAPDVTPVDSVLLLGSPFSSALNLNLTPDSSCIDAGMEVGGTSDIAGRFVPQGDGRDIGAYEWATTVSVIPEDPRELQGLTLIAYPNPFNPQTTVAYSLDRSSQAQLAVYDVTGRRITLLATGEHAAGEHAVVWNGRDGRGRALASGVYYARLQTPDAVKTFKLSLLK